MLSILLALALALATPCPAEDSPNCYWDASARGTGQGHSFVDLGGTAYPLP